MSVELGFASVSARTVMLHHTRCGGLSFLPSIGLFFFFCPSLLPWVIPAIEVQERLSTSATTVGHFILEAGPTALWGHSQGVWAFWEGP